MILNKFTSWITFGIFLFAIFSCKKETPEQAVAEFPIEEENADGNFPYKWLSTYSFFEGELNKLHQNSELLEYSPASSLFTDYALKSRFVSIPKDSIAEIIDGEINFPEGTIFIKNFYYPEDFRKPEDKKRIIETRLLILESTGWEAYPYIWNEAQTDAQLKVVGGQTKVKFTNLDGKEQVIDYLIPNKNQCKSCHNKNEQMSPIGAQIKHLNWEKTEGASPKNQLIVWQEKGKLLGFDNPQKHPSLINYEDKNQTLNLRARAYLDINCAHCHNAEGPASTSGLFLDYEETDPLKLGLNKTPVAAGKGAGKFTYDILPGKPDESILLHRMKSTEVGVAMPEIGRTTVHEEGIQLIRDWILSLK